MNIFVLHRHPRTSARDHCDKHVVKMIMEYAQLLSTAHRVLDGRTETVTWTETIYESVQHGMGAGTYYTESPVGERERSRKVLLLEGETAEMRQHIEFDLGVADSPTKEIWKLHIEGRRMYNATHANHPCAVWVRQSSANYEWLHEQWVTLMEEYTIRYGKRHSAMQYLRALSVLPDNLPPGALTEFPQAMPPQYQVLNDPITAYQRFYVGIKSRFARWTNRDVPWWFVEGITKKDGRYDASRFERSR